VKYTVQFLKYTLLGLLVVIMLTGFIIGAVCALFGILGICLEGNVQYLLLIPVALFCAFMGFVAIDCACAFVDKWQTG
jgi:hypothetical protein